MKPNLFDYIRMHLTTVHKLSDYDAAKLTSDNQKWLLDQVKAGNTDTGRMADHLYENSDHGKKPRAL